MQKPTSAKATAGKQKKCLVKFFSAASSIFVLAIASSQTAFGQWNVSTYSSTNLPSNQLSTIISNIAFWLLAVFGFIAVIGFVISGITYLVSAGDEDTQERAKRAMYYSITGVVVGLAGLVVIYAVDMFLRGAWF
jgi:cytochrome bd-type quinol oxidase subunit 2